MGTYQQRMREQAVVLCIQDTEFDFNCQEAHGRWGSSTEALSAQPPMEKLPGTISTHQSTLPLPPHNWLEPVVLNRHDFRYAAKADVRICYPSGSYRLLIQPVANGGVMVGYFQRYPSLHSSMAT